MAVTRECFGSMVSSDESVYSSFASLDQEVGKGLNSAPGMHWLWKCTKPWLLLFDNADDQSMDFSQYFPATGNGNILVTTRYPGMVEYATAGQLRFGGMDPGKAINILLTFASPKDKVETPNPLHLSFAEGIASELGYLALALVQAGVMIRRGIYTLERYLRWYLRYYLGHRKLLMCHSSIISADEANVITTRKFHIRE
jgi:hypothetical protein